MTDSGGKPGMADEHSADQDADVEHPWGTVLIMVLFVLMIIGMWVWTYATLLDRS
jgi:hypothetical protein